jgi:hypothetical protein
MRAPFVLLPFALFACGGTPSIDGAWTGDLARSGPSSSQCPQNIAPTTPGTVQIVTDGDAGPGKVRFAFAPSTCEVVGNLDATPAAGSTVSGTFVDTSVGCELSGKGGYGFLSGGRFYGDGEKLTVELQWQSSAVVNCTLEDRWTLKRVPKK